MNLTNHNNVILMTMYSYFNSLVQKSKVIPNSKLANIMSHYNLKKPFKRPDMFKTHIRKGLAKGALIHGGNKFWSRRNQRLIKIELDWMEDNGIPVNSEINEYIEISNKRRSPASYLPINYRRMIYQIYNFAYHYRLKDDKKLYSFNDVYNLVPNLQIPSWNRTHFFVDDIQDVSPIALKAVNNINVTWNLFGDNNQRVMIHSVDWENYLMNSNNSSFQLVDNYTESPKVKELSNRLKTSIQNGVNGLSNNIADFSDVKQYYLGDDNEPELISLIKRLLIKDNVLIICMNSGSLTKLGHLLKESDLLHYNKLPHYFNNRSNSEHIVLSKTIYTIKGLKFNQVILFEFDAPNLLNDRGKIIDYNNKGLIPFELDYLDKIKILNRIYCAVGRANKNVFLFSREYSLNNLLNS